MKVYYPVAQCPKGNKIIGLFGSYPTREEALNALDDLGDLAGMLFHVRPVNTDPVFEHEGPITDEEAKANGWVTSDLGGTHSFLVDGPILEKVQSTRKVRAKRKAEVKERTADQDMSPDDILDQIFGDISPDELDALEEDAA